MRRFQQEVRCPSLHLDTNKMRSPAVTLQSSYDLSHIAGYWYILGELKPLYTQKTPEKEITAGAQPSQTIRDRGG